MLIRVIRMEKLLRQGIQYKSWFNTSLRMQLHVRILPSPQPRGVDCKNPGTFCFSYMNGFWRSHVIYSSIITMTSQWVWWRLKWPASRLFAQSFVQAQIKENIKAPRHWPLGGESTGNKGPVTRKMFPFDDVINILQGYLTVPIGWHTPNWCILLFTSCDM